jgi:hypothetical protein
MLGIEAKTSRSAFTTTLQGQQEAQQEAIPKCVCGWRHWYYQCRYLDSSIAPAGWQEKPATRKIVQDKLKDPRIKSNVEKALKKEKEETLNNSQEINKEI